MLHKRGVWVLFLACAVVASAGYLVADDDDDDGRGKWDIEGSWIDRSAGADGWGLPAVITRTGGGEYEMTSDYAGPPAWPGEVKRSLTVGPLRKIGPRTYRFTAISYLLGEDDTVVWTLVASGVWTLVSPNELEIDDYYLALYGPDQDALAVFGAEEPAGGCYGPFGGGMYRVPDLRVPCDPGE